MRALGYFRRTADECDTDRKARHERSTSEVRGDLPWYVTIARWFADHLDEQAAAHAALVDGSA